MTGPSRPPELKSDQAVLVEHIADAIIVVSPEGVALFVNPAALALFDRPAEDLLGRHIGHPVVGGAVTEIEIVRRGEVRTAEMRVAEIEWEGQTAHLASLRDITDRKKLQDTLHARRRMDEIGQLAGGIAHEINNVLAVIAADANLLDAELPADIGQPREYVQEIVRVALRGGKLMRKLLAYGMRERIEPRPLDLGAVVAELGSLIRQLLPAYLEVNVQVDGADLHVMADARAVEQIMINLANNAGAAMKGGGTLQIGVGRVTLDQDFCSRHPGSTPGDFARIEVGDDGTGMPAHVASRVFEAFFTTQPDGSGAGLGMATVYGLVKQHDGYVAVDSREGRGTEVAVYLPLLEGRSVPAVVEARPDAVTGGDEVILFVEDEEALRRAGQRLLRRMGYQVVTATDGQKALELLSSGDVEIDLVLSDIVMPNLGGKELYQALQRLPDRPPILFTSAYSASDLRSEDLLDPSLPLVNKPWELPELAAKIREVLEAED